MMHKVAMHIRSSCIQNSVHRLGACRFIHDSLYVIMHTKFCRAAPYIGLFYANNSKLVTSMTLIHIKTRAKRAKA